VHNELKRLKMMYFTLILLVSPFLLTHETAASTSQISGDNSNVSANKSALLIRKYLEATKVQKIHLVDQRKFKKETKLFDSLWIGNKRLKRTKRWLVLKKKFNITATRNSLFSPCNVSQPLWPDACERASEPNQDRMKCTSIDPLLPPMCVCKKIEVNGTHIVTMRFDAAKGICLSPEGAKCTHRWKLPKHGEQIYFAFGDQQCEQPRNLNTENQIRCGYPNPRKFISYPTDVAFCLKKENSLEEYNERSIRFNDINIEREDILTVKGFRKYISRREEGKDVLEAESSGNFITASSHYFTLFCVLILSYQCILCSILESLPN